jgi:hypothetical protein
MTLTTLRQAELRDEVRRALNAYASWLSLRLAQDLPESEREHTLASYWQAESAKRVLWMESTI